MGLRAASIGMGGYLVERGSGGGMTGRNEGPNQVEDGGLGEVWVVDGQAKTLHKKEQD